MLVKVGNSCLADAAAERLRRETIDEIGPLTRSILTPILRPKAEGSSQSPRGGRGGPSAYFY